MEAALGQPVRVTPDAGAWLFRAGGCFLLAVPITIARAVMSRSLAVEQGPLLSWLAIHLLLGVPLFLACSCLARAYATAPVTPWRRLVVGAVALHLLAWPALPFTSNDVFSNLAYGRMARAGLEPAQLGPSALGGDDPFARLVSPRWRTTPSIYGPLCTAVARWAAGPGEPLAALVRFKLAMLLATLALVGVAFALGRRFPEPEGKRRALLLAASPLVVWEFTSQAHNDALAVLGLALAVWAVLAERPWVALGCALGAVAAKAAALPVAALLAVSMLRSARTRWALLAVLGTAVTLGVTFAATSVIPVSLGALARGPLVAAGAFDADRHTRSIPDALISFTELLGLSLQPRLYWILWAFHIMSWTTALAWAAWRARTPRVALHGATWAFLVFLWTAPWTQAWYGTWLIPLLAVEEDAVLRSVGVVYTFVLVLQYALPIDPTTYLVINAIPLWMLWRARRGQTTMLGRLVPV